MICFDFCKFGKQEEAIKQSAFVVQNQHQKEVDAKTDDIFDYNNNDDGDATDAYKQSIYNNKNTKDLLNTSIDSVAPTIDTDYTQEYHQEKEDDDIISYEQQQQQQRPSPPKFIYDSSLPHDWVNFGSPLYKAKKMTEKEKLVREQVYNEEAKKLIADYEIRRQRELIERNKQQWDFGNFLLSVLGVTITFTVSKFSTK